MTEQDQEFEGDAHTNDVKADQIQINGPWSEKVAKLPFHGCPVCTRPVLMEAKDAIFDVAMARECPECGAVFKRYRGISPFEWELIEPEDDSKHGERYTDTQWSMLTEQRRLADGAQKAIEFVKENGGVPSA